MTKKHLFILLLFAGMLFAGCNDDIHAPEPVDGTIRTLKVTASIPVDDEAGTRVTVSEKEGSKDIELGWKADDKIQLYFKQGETLTKGSEVTVQSISADGKQAEFDVPVPEGITGTFDLYGVHGTESTISDNAILLKAFPSIFLQPIEDISVPIYFKAEGLTNVDGINVTFQHYGALQVLTFKNNSSSRIEIRIFAVPPSSTSEKTGEYGYYFPGLNKYPVYDIISSETSFRQPIFDGPELPAIIPVPVSTTIKLVQWVVPNGNAPDNLILFMDLDTETTIISKNTKPKRPTALQAGHAYHLYAVWDGTDLNFTDEAATVSHSITFTTTRNINETVQLYIWAKNNDRSEIWIDLNNNGSKDEGENVTTFGKLKDYTLGAQTITLYGKVIDFYCNNDNVTSIHINNTLLENLFCYNNQITTLDFGNNTAIETISCSNNQLTAMDVTKFTRLKTLYCDGNHLTELDVKNNTALTVLECYSNKIKVLDVSKNIALTSIRCQANQLQTLDVTTNTNLKEVWCHGNRIRDKMDDLINSLPDRSKESTSGKFRVKLSWSALDNLCTKAQVGRAKNKNWDVENGIGSEFEGD